MSALFDRGATRSYSDVALAQWMTTEAPREGGAPWAASEVRRWFGNRTYLGEVRYGELVKQGAHEALTDEATWQRCQREPGEPRLMASNYLLKGLIRCAGCRYAMSGHTGRYRCGRANRGCPAPAGVDGGQIEEYVTAMVTERQRGLLLAQNESDEANLAAIERFEEAAVEVETFVGDTEARKLLGEASWQEGLRVRVAEREARRPAKDQAVAEESTKKLALLSAVDLDRHGLRDLLVSMVRLIFVRRASPGSPADERALVIWSDDLRPIDLPSRKTGVGPFEPIRW